MVSHTKEKSHQTQEKQEGFEEMDRENFFAALQQVHNPVKRECCQKSVPDREQAQHWHAVTVPGNQRKYNQQTCR